MSSCSACGAENRPGRRFCSQCGATLDVRCASCGAANDPGDRFCGACGAPLDATAAETPAPAATAQRRLVSVLFADVVDVVEIRVEAGELALLEELLAPTANVLAAVVASRLECGRARLFAAGGDAHAADATFAEGIWQLRPLGLPFALARSRLAQASVLFTLGRDEEAANALHEARATFAGLGAVLWLERADRMRSAAPAA